MYIYNTYIYNTYIVMSSSYNLYKSYTLIYMLDSRLLIPWPGPPHFASLQVLAVVGERPPHFASLVLAVVATRACTCTIAACC